MITRLLTRTQKGHNGILRFFATYRSPDGVSLYDCYNNPSYRKKNAYSDLVSMFSYVTVTGFNSRRFTTMSTLDGLNVLFVDTESIVTL